MIKICPYCRLEFETHLKRKKYCSLSCQQKYTFEHIEATKSCQLWIFARDKFKCVYCGKSSIEDGVKLVIEHIFPRYLGGQNTFYNVVTACHQCNWEKNNRVLPKSIILRIWKRNKKLGVKSPYKYVNEIIKEFEDIYPVTQIDLNDYFNIRQFNK